MKVNIGRYPKDTNKERKVDICINNYDAWNADRTLALIIHPLLIELKAQKAGSPCVDDSDVPEYLRSTNALDKGDMDYGVTDSNFHARWRYVLDEMIFAMQDIAHGDSGLADFEVSTDKYNAGRERVQQGCLLFGKYFTALWT